MMSSASSGLIGQPQGGSKGWRLDASRMARGPKRAPGRLVTADVAVVAPGPLWQARRVGKRGRVGPADSAASASARRDRWASLAPDDYLQWAARYLWSGPPQAYLRRRFPVLHGAEDDVLNSCFVALTTTAANTAERQEHFPFADEEHAKAFTNRALRRAALMALRARGRLPATTSIDAFAGSEPWATPDASARPLSISGSSGALPDDPQAVLDRVQAAVRDAVRTDDRYDCPSCGHGDLISLTLGVVEEARDELDDLLGHEGDPPLEPDGDAFDAIPRTTPAGRSVYRAMARAKGEGYVFTDTSAIQDRAKALLRRCRPCVERILDEVIAWIVVTPEDWSGEPTGGPR